MSHLDNITISITLAATPAQAAGFGNVLILVDEASNSLNGNRVVTYTNATDAASDQAAGYITSGVLKAVQTAFAQRPAPARVKLGYVDTSGGETYAQGYAAVKLVDTDFYGVCLDSRTAAVIAAVAAAVEADRRLLVAQSADADWLTTGGVPSGFTGIDGNERTAIVYHDTATEWADVAWACNRLAFDPDSQSAAWDCPVKGVADYATDLTQAQADFADTNNANNKGTAGTYGGEVFYIDPGKSLAGRPIADLISADWLETRLEEALANLKVTRALAGEKIPITKAGQREVMAELEALFKQGVDAGHFVEGQTEVTPQAITSTDISLQRLRFTARAQLVSSMRIVTFTINLGTSALE